MVTLPTTTAEAIVSVVAILLEVVVVAPGEVTPCRRIAVVVLQVLRLLEVPVVRPVPAMLARLVPVVPVP